MISSDSIENILKALDKNIGIYGGTKISIVVCGGTALFALEPNEQEILEACKWVLTQDVSAGFKLILKDFLKKFNYNEIVERI